MLYSTRAFVLLCLSVSAVAAQRPAMPSRARASAQTRDVPGKLLDEAAALRGAGNFEGALDGYRASLQAHPRFYAAQLGLADTYALMGDQPRARQEYAMAMRLARNETERLAAAMQSAITHLREKNFDAADTAFHVVADRAHGRGLARLEAQAYRLMAVYQIGHATALRYLDKAETALLAGRVALSERDQELARILRVRAIKAQADGRQELAAKSLWRLERMAGANADEVIQRSYHAAAGALLMQDDKFVEAVPHLEQDIGDPGSMVRLVQAYERNGDMKAADALRARLAELNEPTIEQAIVVPVVRAAMAQPKTE
jgi:tetratricopeptide (TPR) repeat protein